MKKNIINFKLKIILLFKKLFLNLNFLLIINLIQKIKKKLKTKYFVTNILKKIE